MGHYNKKYSIKLLPGAHPDPRTGGYRKEKDFIVKLSDMWEEDDDIPDIWADCYECDGCHMSVAEKCNCVPWSVITVERKGREPEQIDVYPSACCKHPANKN